MATQGSVTVTTGSATNIKVYALVDGTYRLVADYADVTGTQTITFDLPKGVEDIKVENPTYSFKAKVGDTVSFVGGTRGIETSSDTKVTVSDAGDDITLTESDVKIYRKTLPEGKNNLGVSGVTKDFHLFGVTEMIIYPIYWQTSQTLTLGVYYFDTSNKIVHVPVYTIKDTDTKTARLLVKPKAADAITYDAISFTYTSKGVKDAKGNSVNTTYEDILTNQISQGSWQNGKLSEEEEKNITTILSNAFGTATGRSYTFTLSITKSEDDESYSWTDNGTTKYGGKFTYKYTKDAVAESDDWVVFTDSKSKDRSISEDFEGKILSKGIKVTLPNDLKFGMYITYKDSDDKDVYFYSQEAQNSDGLCHAATYTTSDSDNKVRRYLGFEDWPNIDEKNPSDLDLNDLIVRLDYSTATTGGGVVDEDESSAENNPLGWIVACEDLGSTDDWDFNDIVLHVSYANYKTGKDDETRVNVTIQALAAGGVLPAYIYFNASKDKLTESHKVGEIHEMLGVTSPLASGNYPMINTTSITTDGTTVVKNIDNYSISTDDNDVKDPKIAKFIIVVGSDDANKASAILKASEGSAPQLFIVPDTWKWPKERTHIKTAYPKFTDWVTTNKKDSYDWYTDRTDATGDVVGSN